MAWERRCVRPRMCLLDIEVLAVPEHGVGAFRQESLHALDRIGDEAASRGEHVEGDLRRYVAFARNQGIPATSRYSIDTEAVAGAERLCLDLLKEYPRVTFFTGKVIFGKERWYHALLHNGTAYAIQKRLQWAGQMVVVVPVRVT